MVENVDKNMRASVGRTFTRECDQLTKFLIRRMKIQLKRYIQKILYIFYFGKMKFGHNDKCDIAMWDRNVAFVYFSESFKKAPEWLKEHRKYFTAEDRGFGENAFHAAWLYLFDKYEINSALEIGVYRGQVISLWQLISDKIETEICISGISPMTSQGDEVSEYIDLNYEEDILRNFKYFRLDLPELIKERSDSEIAKNRIENGEWDLIYIDGSHDFEEALGDYLSAIKGLKKGGILVMDDSSLFTNFRLSFSGHPGPSRVISEFPSNNLVRLFSVGHNNFFRKVKEG